MNSRKLAHLRNSCPVAQGFVQKVRLYIYWGFLCKALSYA